MGIFKKLAGLDDNKIKTTINNDQLDYQEETDNIEEDTDQEIADQETDDWLDGDYEEGQLSVDVYQTSDKIIVKSTIAGVKPEDIDISINNDMLTIRGKREMQEEIEEENYLFRECYWGGFSRSIILPVEIQAEKIEASLENGVLTIILPKAKIAKKISVKVKEK